MCDMAACQASCDSCCMRRYTCPGFERLSPWFKVALACILNFFTGGVVYGWSSLQQVYKDENVSAELCAANYTTRPCPEQDFYLGLVFSVASTGNMCAGLPMGLLVDLAGPRIAFFVSELLVVVGAVLLGVGDFFPFIYIPAFLVLGIGGTGVQVSLMHTSALFPKNKANVTNAIHACFQLSFLIFALFQLIYNSDPRISSSDMFLVYSCVAVLCLVAGLFWPGKAYGGGHGHGGGKDKAASIIIPPGGFSVAGSRAAAATTYATNASSTSDDELRKAALMGDDPETSPHHPADYHLHENDGGGDEEEDDDALNEESMQRMVVVSTMGVLTDRSILGNQQRLVSQSVAARAAAPSLHAKPELDPITASFRQQIGSGDLWACVVFITIGIVFSNSFIATLGACVQACAMVHQSVPPPRSFCGWVRQRVPCMWWLWLTSCRGAARRSRSWGAVRAADHRKLSPTGCHHHHHQAKK
jgi:hypothetical protein